MKPAMPPRRTRGSLAELANRRIRSAKVSEVTVLRKEWRAAIIRRDRREASRIQRLLQEIAPEIWRPPTADSRRALLEKLSRFLEEVEAKRMATGALNLGQESTR